MGMMPQSAARAMRHASNVTQAPPRRARLAERLGKLHGLPQKIGQILSLNELDEVEPACLRLTENEAALPAEAVFALTEGTKRIRIWLD